MEKDIEFTKEELENLLLILQEDGVEELLEEIKKNEWIYSFFI